MKKFGISLLVLVSACAEEASRPVEVSFVAALGAEDAACGQVYENVGVGGNSLALHDLRFYVHDVRLVDEGGAEVPVALEQDGVFQDGDVALLDFEDGTAGCSETGTAEVNESVVGSVPEGRYVGLRFTLGVPFERNHENSAEAPSPLNLTTLFWNWQGGYKFMRVDGLVDGATPVVFHLGSTACTADNDGIVTGCANENRAEVELMGFDPDADQVKVDLAALFEAVDLNVNAPDSPSGCMSSPSDTDCAGYFAGLGLPFGTEPAGTQQVFSVAP